MHKILVIIFYFLFVFLFVFNFLSCFYPQSLTVKEIDYENDLVYIETSEGFIYSFSGSSDWEVGDKVAAIMFNHFSKGIKDDLVIKVKYCR